jgi:hypothetical protein
VITIRTLICLVSALGVSSTLASEPSFQFSREITPPQLTQDELLAVTLDTSVFAATEAGLPDMRLHDGQGGAVAYLLRKAQATRTVTVRKTWSSRQPDARPLEGGGLEITVELKEDDPQPTGLSLVSRLKDFEQRVHVFSSPTGEQWETLGEESVIFDYSRYMDVRRDSVRFQETPDRHFRIVIDNVTAEQESELLALTRRLRGNEETGREERVTIRRRPFRIERIDFWREDEQERSTGDKKTDYPISKYRVEQDPEKQQTIVLIDASREPLTSLELQTPEANFSRRAAVEVEKKRGVQTSWQSVGAATLSRIDFKSLQREELGITFPESRQKTYRLVIDNRDSPPLQVEGIQASGNVYEILFLASPNASYQLVYGSTTAESPQYDTAAIRRVLGEGFQPARAELGPVVPVGGPPGEFQWSNLLNNKRLLFGAIVLLVIVLAWGLFQAVKRFDNLPDDLPSE